MALLDHLAVGITIGDARVEGFPLVYANPTFLAMTGYEPAEALGRTCSFLQGPGTDPSAAAALGRALRAGEAANVTLLNERKDGAQFWNAVMLSPVVDAAGDLTHYLGIQVDVTERVEQVQSALDAERRFRALVEGRSAVFYVNRWDPGEDGPDVRCAYISPFVEELTGYPAARFVEDAAFWYTRVHPDDRPRVRDEVHDAQRTERGYHSEYRFITADGRTIWLSDNSEVVRDDEGRPTGEQGALVDVSALRDAEARLQEEVEVLAAIGEAVLVLDARGEVVASNAVADAGLGVSGDEWGRWVDAEDTRLAFEDGTPLTRRNSPVAEVLRTGEPRRGLVLRVRTARGERIAQGSILPRRGPAGQVTGAVVSMADVTEHRRREGELAQARDVAQRALDSVDTPLLQVEADGRVSLANRPACELLGVGERELVGRSWLDDVVEASRRERTAAALDALAEDEDEATVRFEDVVLGRDGRATAVRWTATRLHAADGSGFATLLTGEPLA